MILRWPGLHLGVLVLLLKLCALAAAALRASYLAAINAGGGGVAAVTSRRTTQVALQPSWRDWECLKVLTRTQAAPRIRLPGSVTQNQGQGFGAIWGFRRISANPSIRIQG